MDPKVLGVFNFNQIFVNNSSILTMYKDVVLELSYKYVVP